MRSISAGVPVLGVCAMRAARAWALSETFRLTGARLNSSGIRMALKSATVNASTPAERVAKAEQMLGKVVEPPKTRWNPGSLFGQALSLIEEPVVGYISPARLVVVGFATSAQASAAMSAFASSVIGSLEGTAADPGNGSLRSRIVDFGAGCNYQDAVMTGAAYESLDAELQGVVNALSLPVRPTVTGASLASKIDAYFQDREVPVGYELALSQFDGRFVISPADSGSDGSLTTAAGAYIIASFDLAVPTSEPVTPETGPIFG